MARRGRCRPREVPPWGWGGERDPPISTFSPLPAHQAPLQHPNSPRASCLLPGPACQGQTVLTAISPLPFRTSMGRGPALTGPTDEPCPPPGAQSRGGVQPQMPARALLPYSAWEEVFGHPVGSGPHILQVLSALSWGDGGTDQSHTTASHPHPRAPLHPTLPGACFPRRVGQT